MIVAFTGPAGSGKDTAAMLVVANCYRDNQPFEQYAFAGPMRAMLKAIGIKEPARELKELELAGFPFSYRKAMQTLGTEFGRTLDPDLWVTLFQDKATVTHNLVVTDLRFVNEAQRIRALGGVIIKITGRSTDLGDRAKHVSEDGLPDTLIDFTLSNTGTKLEFEKSVENLLRRLQLWQGLTGDSAQ